MLHNKDSLNPALCVPRVICVLCLHKQELTIIMMDALHSQGPPNLIGPSGDPGYSAL